MQHLGDITQISGHTAPVVDCIIGGSPCQDVSIAGRRAGLAGALEVWRKVKVKNSEGETEEVWENTHRLYKHKTKEQMVRWYNRSFVYDTDSARYMALGKSIALPYWKWLCKRISAQYERDATMGSLFDGIGGFPLVWEQINGKGSCLWASEIEEFPIAVTRYHFGEEGAG